MNSAAMSSPREGVPRPSSASDARKDTSAFRSLAVSREAICWAVGAVWAAAPAAHAAFHVLTEPVVDRQFPAPPDRPLAHVEDVVLENAGIQVGLATVVDDLGARAAHRSIDRPVIVEGEQVGQRTVAAALSLTPVDLLTRVFDDLVPGGNVLAGINAPAMDSGFPDRQLETCVAGIDYRGFDESCGHGDCTFLAL